MNIRLNKVSRSFTKNGSRMQEPLASLSPVCTLHCLPANCKFEGNKEEQWTKNTFSYPLLGDTRSNNHIQHGLATDEHKTTCHFLYKDIGVF
jgi:hypothetical protein